jgi:amino acid adenylation domain-containing protein
MDINNTNIVSTLSIDPISYSCSKHNTSKELELSQDMPQSKSLETLSLPVLSSIQSRLSFLENLLAGKLPVLEIPTTKTRAKINDFIPASQSLLLSKVLSAALNDIGTKEKVSLECILLTAFQILLYRYTNQAEIIVGTPAKNLSNWIIENKFDTFEKVVLLPLELKSVNSFNQLIQILQITLDAQEQQNLSINPEIAKTLIQNSKHTAIFQVLFELQNIAEGILNQPRWDIFQLDLIVKIIEQPTGLACEFTYNSNLFDAAQITRMMQHWQVLLESIVANPEQPVATLNLLTPEELQQQAVWNHTQVNYPDDQCIHQLFEQQVAKTPEAIALIFEEQQLTYRELNQRADVLAAYLGELGVTAEVLVGICVERSVEMVVGILAILKAGGAYVPLDSSYPLERIGYMLSDAQVAVLLTQQSLNLGELLVTFPQPQTKVIYLEQIPLGNTPENPPALATDVNPSNLAYVIYTSGSTGKPKGVQIEHRTVVNLLRAIAQSPGIDAGDTLLSVTTISFDIAVLEIFLPLIVGAKLAIVSRQTAMDGHQLIQALEQYQATLMQSTPITWKMLLAAGWQGSKNLTMFSGGEALSKQLAQELVNKGAALWNLYGPTETTIWSSIQQVKADQESISIGRPIANVRYYILDPNLMPLPVGVPGELYIGGDCLARGYLNRPELTAERFISDPFAEQVKQLEQPAARMYKTGDLACYFADGTVNCLGRLDRQVKIRGFRIEIEEIELAILQYPGVQAVAVVVQENASGYQRLVGYLVNQPNVIVEHEALRRWLQQKLPAHMVPFGFMTIPSLPLTLNGKVDPKALPRIDFINQTITENYVAPRNELEKQIASIWEKVLEVKPVGIHDDFLALGGGSILAIALVNEIEQTLQQKMPLNALSNLTTVEQMALCFAEGQPTIQDLPITLDGISADDYQALLTIMAGRKGDRPRPNSLMVAMQNQGSKPPFFFCANAYEEAVELKDYLGQEQPFYLMESGYFTLESNNRQIKALAAHHLEDILTVQPQPPYRLGGYSTGGLIAWEIAQQLRAMGKEVALLAIIDTDGSHPIYQNYQQLNYTLRTNWNKISQLQMPEKLNYLRARIELRSRFSPEKYTADPYVIQPYPGVVALFLATETDHRFFFSHKLKFWLCPRAGWHPGIAPHLKIERVPGDHFDMLAAPNVQILGAKLSQYLG